MTASLPLKCTWKACCCGFLASDTNITFRKQLEPKECEIPRGSLFPFLSFGGQWLREMVCFGRLLIELQTRQGWTSCLFVITLLGLGWSVSQWQVELHVRTLQQIKSQFGACSGFGLFSVFWQVPAGWKQWPCLLVWVDFVLALDSPFLHDPCHALNS